MTEGVHGSRKNAAESTYPAFIGPPTVRENYEPANVNWGYKKFIEQILNNGRCDTFQGPPPAEDKKKEDRIQQFLKWSGIAFGVVATGATLRKALAYAKKEGAKAALTAMKDGEKVAEIAVKEGTKLV
jgi:hypothetical protein